MSLKGEASSEAEESIIFTSWNIIRFFAIALNDSYYNYLYFYIYYKVVTAFFIKK